MDGYVTIGTELDTSDFDAEIKYIENQMEEIEYKLKQADMGFDVGDTQKLEASYSKLNRQLTKLVKKQQDLNKSDLSNLTKSIDNVGSSVSKTIKKVTRWGLAIFGIRSAYMAVRQAMSTLSQYDDQLASNVEYIRYALASVLKPVIEYLVNLVYKLLSYVNYLAKAWFNVDLFANASADGMKQANKQAKQLSKTLAGFDEMNVLSDTSGADAGGGVSPSFDLSKMQGDIPEWLKWIRKNGDKIAAIIAGISAGLIALKFGASGLMALGIGIAISGIILAITSLLKYLNDPSWKNFGGIIQGIGIAVVGLGLIIGNLPLAVSGAAILIVGTVIKYWDKIKEFLQNGIDWLKTKGREIFEMIFGKLFTPIYDAFVNILQSGLNFLDRTFTNIKTIFDNIIGFVKNVFTGNWKGACENIKNIFFAIFDQIKAHFKLVFDWINNLVIGIGTTVGNILGGAFKAVVNGVLRAIENILNTPIKTINSLIKTINKVPGINLGTLGTFNLPRLAKGGIINQPGRGVMIGGSAIGGEKGIEGVIPLTDSQQMALLGEAIGKFININATIPIQVGNRLVAREIKKIMADDDFAYNR